MSVISFSISSDEPHHETHWPMRQASHLIIRFPAYTVMQFPCNRPSIGSNRAIASHPSETLEYQACPGFLSHLCTVVKQPPLRQIICEHTNVNVQYPCSMPPEIRHRMVVRLYSMHGHDASGATDETGFSKGGNRPRALCANRMERRVGVD